MELTLKQKTAFGIGAVGKDMVYALSASYVMYYYQDVLGLSASFVGVVLMAARFFDAFNDPFMGVLVAKTRTRWGRFRPWIFSGTLLNALVLYALFAAPVLDEAALMVYFSVVYILWGVTYTMMDIPYWSIFPWWAVPVQALALPSSPCSPCCWWEHSAATASAPASAGWH